MIHLSSAPLEKNRGVGDAKETEQAQKHKDVSLETRYTYGHKDRFTESAGTGSDVAHACLA